mgnify:FL=1
MVTFFNRLCGVASTTPHAAVYAAAPPAHSVAAHAPTRMTQTVLAASKRVASFVHRTPTFTSTTVNAAAGAGRSVIFKAESLQKTGSFKIRGAVNAMLQIAPDDAKRGVVTHSSGNHGQAVAAAAAMVGLSATVVLPETVPAAKVRACEMYGAQVVFCKPSQSARLHGVAEIVERTGATVVPPYDHMHVVEGQATLGYELMEQHPELDAIIVPTSGGGLLAGVAMGAKAINPAVRVFAVEPEGKGLGVALRENVRTNAVADEPIDTIADAIRTRPLGAVPWPIVRELAEHHVFTVNDAEIAAGMRFGFERMKLVVEPAAGCGIATVVEGHLRRYLDAEEEEDVAAEEEEDEGRRVRSIGVILCGGNVDLDVLPW